MRSRGEHKPIRTCVGCGERGRQDELVRLRLTADGNFSETERRGRSAYVHASSACAHDLVRSKRLTRALRVNVAHDVRANFAEALMNRFAEGADEIGKTIVCRR